MNKRQIIAALVEKTGIKISEDDPAFLLVELNMLMLENRTGEAAKLLEEATKHFNDVTIRNVDDFVAVANETLVRFNDKTREIQAELARLDAQSATVQPTAQPAAQAARKIDALSFVLGAIVLAVGCVCGLLLR